MPHGRPIDRGLLAAIIFIGCMGPAAVLGLVGSSLQRHQTSMTPFQRLSWSDTSMIDSM